MLMLEKLLNQEVKKNVVKLVTIPVLFPKLEKSHQMPMKQSDWGESRVYLNGCFVLIFLLHS